VVVADINAETAAETVALARQDGHCQRVHFVRTDVTSESDVAAAIAPPASASAGSTACSTTPAWPARSVRSPTSTRTNGTGRSRARARRVLGMKHGARVMKTQGQGGSFINTASIAGSRGGDGPQAYSAAKAAVINLTRAVAIELAPQRIRVNAICPAASSRPLLHRGSPKRSSRCCRNCKPWPEVGQARAYRQRRAVSGERRRPLRHRRGAGGRRRRDAAAGRQRMQSLGQGQMLYAAAGVDRGTTGLEPTLRTVEE
jgi:NAD(P)-dependent dehydrogenase (short-subunit alcohol dehydrogenase family)